MVLQSAKTGGRRSSFGAMIVLPPPLKAYSLPWMVMERESDGDSPFTLLFPDWEDILSRDCCGVSIMR